MANDQKGMAAAKRAYVEIFVPVGDNALDAAITAYLAASTPAKTELVEHSFNARDLELAPEVLAKALELAVDRGGQTLPISDYDISRAKVIINGENSEIAALRDALTTLTAERDGLHGAMTKISAIRDSIIGTQTMNWSEHIYPLVAALGEAGFEGAGYEISRKNMGTLIDQVKAAEAALTASQAEVASLRELIDDLRDAASSFRDESGDEVAGQIITRIDAAIEAGRVK